MMKSTTNRSLSAEGLAFLNESKMFNALSAIAASVGVTPEEYLLRFEEVLSENPEAIFGIFQKMNTKTNACSSSVNIPI